MKNRTQNENNNALHLNCTNDIKQKKSIVIGFFCFGEGVNETPNIL
ncbi:hypothetical protein [Aminipila terrae]|uniref:Uncharacterized protein n=1 Tax=Aminipila terrae TaxID=2697030 RepID=A0A6P1MCF8_9FIRM|nr:hypothetical protein [Aminipila terrae]QHI71587.1 hypothetical protein Ami3637_03595 [Aminipila terrae]